MANDESREVRSRRVRVATDVELAYDDAGSGPPLLLVHGFPLDRTLWRPQMGTLARQARLIAPDLRGFGESDAAAPYSMERYADDLVAVLDALGIDRAIVAGVSMGGYITFALWRRHPERVRALVLVDTRAVPDTDAGRTRRREMIALARSRGAAAIADEMLPTLVGTTTREERSEIAREVHAMMARAPVPGIVGALEAMMARPDSTPTLGTITVPTLVVRGEEDAIATPEDAESMRRGIAGSRLAAIPRAGHASNVERPSAFDRVVADFLATLPA